MPLHKKAETPAEELALHLEETYGLQLPADRHRQLVKEIEQRFANVVANVEAKPVLIADLRGAVARGWCAEKNVAKAMDVDLAEAITAEVASLIAESRVSVIDLVPEKEPEDAA